MAELYSSLDAGRLAWLQSQPDVANHYDGKKVLITGGHGFIGRVVTQYVQGLGATTVTPLRSDYDLTDQLDTSDLFRTRGPFDVVFHLAAGWMGIGRTAANPARSYFDNLQMGVNVIDACHVEKNTKVVVAGSVCAYPENCPVPYREHNLWHGNPEPTNGPYGLAKRTLLTMLQAYHAQYKLPSAYLLLGNAYGPGDNFDLKTSHVIPALIRKFEEAKRESLPEVEIWGDPNVTRSFCYVTDTAAGLVLAGARVDTPDPINVGSDAETYLDWLVMQVKGLVGYKGRYFYNSAKPAGQKRRNLYIGKAYEQLGWEPAVPLRTGLQATYEWYMEKVVEDVCQNKKNAD